jgi:hypothetical protein
MTVLEAETEIANDDVYTYVLYILICQFMKNPGCPLGNIPGWYYLFLQKGSCRRRLLKQSPAVILYQKDRMKRSRPPLGRAESEKKKAPGVSPSLKIPAGTRGHRPLEGSYRSLCNIPAFTPLSRETSPYIRGSV